MFFSKSFMIFPWPFSMLPGTSLYRTGWVDKENRALASQQPAQQQAVRELGRVEPSRSPRRVATGVNSL